MDTAQHQKWVEEMKVISRWLDHADRKAIDDAIQTYKTKIEELREQMRVNQTEVVGMVLNLEQKVEKVLDATARGKLCFTPNPITHTAI